MRKVNICCGLNPGSTFKMRSKLRISSPAPTSNTSPIAVSATTSVLCSRYCRRPPVAPRPLSPSAVAGLLRSPPRWQYTEQHTRHHRHRNRKPKHSAVHRDLVDPWQSGRQQLCAHPQQHRSSDYTQSAAAHRQHHRLHKQLSQYLAAGRSQGRPNRKFSPPHAHPAQQQTGNVDANNHQQAGYRAKQYPQRRLHPRHNVLQLRHHTHR